MDIQKRLEEKQERYTYLMIVASCLCLIIQLYAMPRDNTRLMSLANHGLLLLWWVVGGIRILKRVLTAFPVKLISFLWLLLFAMAALLASVLKSTSSIVANVTAFLNFMVLPIMLLYSTFYTIPEKAKTVLIVTGVLLSAVFIQLYHSNLRSLYTNYYGDTLLDQVTLGYSNPNQTAIYLFVCIIDLVIGVFYVKEKLIKVFLSLDAAYIYWIMFQTETRTAILLMLVFLVLMLITQKRELPQISVDIAIVTPLVYAFMAMFFFPLFGEIMFWGETLFNGRENIFGRYLENLNIISFLFGNYADFRFENLHNGYVAIAATAGIFTMAYYMVFVRKCLRKNYPDAISQKYTAVSFLGFLCLMIYSCTEAALFVGGSTYAFLIFKVFLFFSRPFAVKRSHFNEESTQ